MFIKSIIILIAYELISIDSFYFSYTNRAKIAFSTNIKSDSSNSDSINLPIVQVYQYNDLNSEFIFGKDFELSLKKLNYYLSSLSEKVLSIDDLIVQEYITPPFDNIYDDNSINSTLSLNSIVIIKLYRDHCRKCQNLEPIFHELSLKPKMKNFKWTQANIDHIPLFKNKLLQRLSGKESPENSQFVCSKCQNSGFVECLNCKSTGLVSRNELHIICPSCLGIVYIYIYIYIMFKIFKISIIIRIN